jgi:hypothetical protein
LYEYETWPPTTRVEHRPGERGGWGVNGVLRRILSQMKGNKKLMKKFA